MPDKPNRKKNADQRNNMSHQHNLRYKCKQIKKKKYLFTFSRLFPVCIIKESFII